MITWLEGHPELLRWSVIVSVGLFLASVVVIPWLVARLPVDYFSDPTRHKSKMRKLHPLQYIALRVLKDVTGFALIVAGLAMLVLPGQGLLTLVIGVALVDFPGKYRVERWIASRKSVFTAINWIRSRAGVPPFLAPAPLGSEHARGDG